MRKLIGHSAPVYGLSFSPSAGSAAPPRHLLSSSGDGTIRLWSMDTYSALVAYKGHQDPVWDVEWGPSGVYFASGGRDRTARLWVAERTSALRMFVGHLGDVDVSPRHSTAEEEDELTPKPPIHLLSVPQIPSQLALPSDWL